jgi:hypothetical protein
LNANRVSTYSIVVFCLDFQQLFKVRKIPY